MFLINLSWLKRNFLMLKLLTVYYLLFFLNCFQASMEEGKRSTNKSKRVNQGTPPAKQGKLVKPLERSSPNADSGRATRDLTEATAQISMTKQSSLPTKARTLRKSELKALAQKDLKPSENSTDEHLDQSVYPVNDKSILLKVYPFL